MAAEPCPTAVPAEERPAARPATRATGPALHVERGAPPAPARRPAARRWVLLAFATVYVVWGSTYLGIRIAIETLPPFLMAGARFLVAGSALYAFARLRGGAVRPTRAEWRGAAVVGGLLLVGGNGGVVWAEQRVASGAASLIVATVPLWMVLLDWARPGGRRPSAGVAAGLLLGTLGLLVLVGRGALSGHGAVDGVGALVLLGGSLSWAAGSVAAKRVTLPASALLGTAMEMLVGGALLTAAALATGERLDVAAVSARSALALLYLVVFGSLVGYTAYTWLLQVASPARVSTYAYVNPVVAVLLGWAVLGEPLTARTWAAAAIIVAGVAVITATKGRAGETRDG